VQLRHTFVVPAGLEETWRHFQDISAVASCFPGAKVTSVEGDNFTGTAKVKLGPVALQYAGSGSFIERDESAHRLVFEAQGRDKRGNGTAGATVTMTFAAEDADTRADVVTDLSVTGKPAQFGQRMLQEVSDKLLGQFVDCLQHQVGAPSAEAPPAALAAGEAEGPVTTAPEAPAASSQAAPLTDSAAVADVGGGPVPESSAPQPGAPVEESPPASDDALDLGATVLPVIARMYGKHIGAGLLVLLVLWWLRRRLTRH
jgi:uncharacterized protein